MDFILNGNEKFLIKETTILELLESLDIKTEESIVLIDDEVIDKTNYSMLIEDGCVMEVVKFETGE